MQTDNQTFWDQCKQMFADPGQRTQLLQYFEQCVQELTADPKPMVIAVVGELSRCYLFYSRVKKAFKKEFASVLEPNYGNFKIAHYRFVRCYREDDAQGREFDAYIDLSGGDSKAHDMLFYMVARNIPHMKPEALMKDISLHLQTADYVNFE